MNRPECIANIADVPTRHMKIARTGEALGVASLLSDHFGLKRLRIQHETLPPGHRASSPHAHTTSEEFIYILEGHPDVWIDGNLCPLGPGDSVAFIPGTGVAHTLINNSDHDARLLSIAVEDGDDRRFYPSNPGASDVPADIAEAWSARPRGPHPGTAK
jgi:uncharacterized cupin superfamily protein